MKKIVLKVVKQCAATKGVTPQYIKHDILPEFFEWFRVRRMTLDRRNYRQVVEATVELAQKAGVSEIVGRIVNDLKDEAKPYQKMETITKVVAMLRASDNDERFEAVSSTALSILSRSRPREIKSCSMVSARSSMLRPPPTSSEGLALCRRSKEDAQGEGSEAQWHC